MLDKVNNISLNNFLNPQNPPNSRVGVTQKPANNTLLQHGKFSITYTKNNNKKKITAKDLTQIGLASLAASIVLVSLFGGHPSYRGAFPDLPKHIDFKNSNTMNEAIKFAKDTFKIDLQLGDNLKLANMVNLIIVNLSNLLKGKIYLPEVIKLDKLSDNTAGTYQCSTGIIKLSADYNTQNLPTYGRYKQVFANNKGYIKYVLENKPEFKIWQDLKETITHEIGHHCHAGNNIEKFASDKFDLKKMLKNRYNDAETFFKKYFGVTAKDEKVYAMHSPQEFVAESFNVMFAKDIKLPDYIRKVYKELGGYLPKDF